MTVGERVRALREQKGWTVRDLAERADVSHSYVSRLENGHAGEKRVELEKIAGALGMPLSAVLEDQAARAMAEVLRDYGIDEETRLHVQEISSGLPVAAPKLARHVKEQIRLLAELLRPNGDQERARAAGQ